MFRCRLDAFMTACILPQDSQLAYTRLVHVLHGVSHLVRRCGAADVLP